MILKVDVGAFNPVYVPYLEDCHRYQLFFGGSSSGKSCFLATRAVLDALRGRNILVVRKVQRTLAQSCFNEIFKAMRRMGAERFFRVSRSELSMTVRRTGAQILFAGLDDVEKIKSISPAAGPLTDVWLEEATECTRDDFKQLDKRLRGPTAHRKRVTLSFNPTYRDHWLFREFFSGWVEEGQQPPPGVSAVPGRSFSDSRVTILRTTYRDNRFLTEDDIRALTGETSGYYHAVYTLGQWGTRGSAVFTNWRVEDLRQRRPPSGLPVYYGLDFGFGRDPSACVRCAFDGANRRVYVTGAMMETGLVVWKLAERLRPFVGRSAVTCDSADPRCIAELRALGVSAVPARKGRDSLLHGIQWLQGMEIVVDRGLKDMIRELTAYSWGESGPEDRVLPRPGDDHLIDALRYALESEQLLRRARLYPGKGVRP